ncbi:MAG: DUF2911 domain-containing protein [Chitinophagaceae bacterium]
MAIFKRQLLVLLCISLCTLVACHEEKPKPANQVHINPSAPSTATQLPDKYAAAGLDQSPMDMAYYPLDYPKLKMSKNLTEDLVARVIYSRPQKNGRVIFGDVLKYDAPWRLGANEATEIEFFKDVSIQNRKVPKGRYVLYCVPHENEWTVVLNGDLYVWGLKIDSTKDIDRFKIPIEKTKLPFEVFTMDFQKAPQGMQLVIRWDSVRATLPINY